MKTCINLKEHSLKLEQRGIDSFRVTYGKQVTDRMTYNEAAAEFGSCLMHSLASMGKLDNRVSKRREY